MPTTSQPARVFVLDAGGAIAALAVLIDAAGPYAELQLFTTERMGRNLLLYERLGFVETHRATVSGHSRVFMTKSVRPSS